VAVAEFEVGGACGLCDSARVRQVSAEQDGGAGELWPATDPDPLYLGPRAEPKCEAEGPIYGRGDCPDGLNRLVDAAEEALDEVEDRALGELPDHGQAQGLCGS